MKKVLKILWNIFEIIVIAYVIFMTSYILCRNKFGFTQFNKYTFVTLNEENYKFVPNHNEGDLLVIESKKFGIEEGSTIYYYVVANDSYVVRSGVVKSKVEDDFSVIYYLDDEDETSVSNNRVIGKDVKFSSGNGYILEFLEGKIGFLIFVLLPVMLIFIYRIYDLFVSSKYRNVDFEEDEEEDNEEEEDRNINNGDTVEVKSVVVDTPTSISETNSNAVESNQNTLENEISVNEADNFDKALENINKPIITEKTGFDEMESVVENQIVEPPQIINIISDNEVSSDDETEIL